MIKDSHLFLTVDTWYWSASGRILNTVSSMKEILIQTAAHHFQKWICSSLTNQLLNCIHLGKMLQNIFYQEMLQYQSQLKYLHTRMASDKQTTHQDDLILCLAINFIF